MESYPFEYSALYSGQKVSKSSKLLPLSPFMNDERVLCVGGRLKFANVPRTSKNQMIVSKSHYLARLIIIDIHQRNLHTGREQTLCLIRNVYWIPSCRGLIRTVLKECLYCKRYTVKAKPTYMADLPKDRMLAGQKPFTSTGIDLFGPMLVKRTKGTRSNAALVKRYGIIFTCMTVRAIHLELTNDLSTDSFIMAPRRFKSRRGHVQVIRSDNGTNFVGAASELKDAFKTFDRSKVNRYCCEQEIDFQWIFNPPFSPWMGGAWESLIKSVKRALKAITLDRVFTDEALYTFLCETECIINQRPLTAISDDVNDFDTLTPNHFLIGEAHSNQSPGEFSSKEINQELFKQLPIFYGIVVERNIS